MKAPGTFANPLPPPTMKTAILQVADCGPLESLVVMLRAAGYRCLLPSEGLRTKLRELGGLVLSPRDLERGMGYDPPFPEDPLPLAGEEDLRRCDLFVDVKAHQTYLRLVAHWPSLRDRVLWYRINGGKPEHVTKRDEQGRVVEDHGDEVDPPCPVLTPNQWYGIASSSERSDPNRFYVCWPPFVRFGDYGFPRGAAQESGRTTYEPPLCLIHNLTGWGYGALVDRFRKELGLRCYGRGSPNGLLSHQEVPRRLAATLATVHLKSSDAPGYALYESLAAACPVVCTRRLIWRCRMEDLLIPGETCLVFDRETHEGLTAADVEACTAEVAEHLSRLAEPGYNRRVGEAGRTRLRELMWREDRDGPGLREWLGRVFP